MATRIKVHVTQEHIDKGECCSVTRCPVALALKERFLGKTVVVGKTYVQINQKFYRLDSKGCKFIRAFDDGRKVQPIEVTLTKIL